MIKYNKDKNKKRQVVKMKKVLAAILVMMMVLSMMTVFADDATIVIDGKKAEIPDGMGSVTLKDSRTFVPVRFVLEQFGYEVAWQEDDQLVFGRNTAGDIFIMQIDNPLLIFKGADSSSKTINMDVVPFINNNEGRTYIPLRFLAEVLGYEANWDDATRTASFTKK